VDRPTAACRLCIGWPAAKPAAPRALAGRNFSRFAEGAGPGCCPCDLGDFSPESTPRIKKEERRWTLGGDLLLRRLVLRRTSGIPREF
jgi:hypothetical protein